MNFSAISHQSAMGKLIRLPLRLIPRQTVVPILQGPLRGMKWIVGSGVHGYWLGSYEYDKQKAFLEAIKPDQVVFDIGANVGFYTLLAAKAVGPQGRVVAFEPLPKNLHYLRQHVLLNRLDNVVIIEPIAVADQPGRARFSLSRHAAMNRLTEEGELEVIVSTLDTEATKLGLVPNVLKVDVEGAELKLLQGAAKTLMHHPTILLATHGDALRLGCIEYLESLNYSTHPLASANGVNHADEFIAVCS